MIAYIIGLLSINRVSNFLKQKLPIIKEIHLDLILLILLHIGIIISASSYYEEVKRKKDLETQVELLKNYSYIATFTIDGQVSLGGGGLLSSSEVSSLVPEVFTMRSGGISWNCDYNTLNKFRTVIESYPDFPFSYYCLAKCLYAEGDKSWRTYAVKAFEILEKTTKITPHHRDHDEALKELEGYLKK